MVEVETAIHLRDIISWVISFGSFVAVAVWMKLTLARHEAALFNPQGECRLLSFEAHKRLQAACQERFRLEKMRDSDAITALLLAIKELREDVKQLSKCVTILAAGGKAEDC
ncbi:MAG: hypothetical protein OEV91_02440 [Desulfobulbaceae bacterium]|nr:hypothetical protein [Desulfobulbaceae bacterium]